MKKPFHGGLHDDNPIDSRCLPNELRTVQVLQAAFFTKPCMELKIALETCLAVRISHLTRRPKCGNRITEAAAQTKTSFKPKLHIALFQLNSIVHDGKVNVNGADVYGTWHGSLRTIQRSRKERCSQFCLLGLCLHRAS